MKPINNSRHFRFDFCLGDFLSFSLYVVGFSFIFLCCYSSNSFGEILSCTIGDLNKGQWVNIPHDYCSGFSSSGGLRTMRQIEKKDGIYKINTLVNYGLEQYHAVCGAGNDLGSLEKVCVEFMYGGYPGSVSLKDDGACIYTDPYGNSQSTLMEETLSSVSKWRCITTSQPEPASYANLGSTNFCEQ